MRMTKENNSDIDNSTSKASSSYERDMEISSFCTSTPKSINCQECHIVWIVLSDRQCFTLIHE